MSADVPLLAPSGAQLYSTFYATPRGAVACSLVRDRLKATWPSLDGMSVLGLGYASPYVRIWTGSARRCVVAVPSQMEAVRWPTVSGNLTCTMAEDALPFPTSASTASSWSMDSKPRTTPAPCCARSGES